jgi:tRNA threonylcarbamoyladenosine biosynthesis protein TsaE
MSFNSQIQFDCQTPEDTQSLAAMLALAAIDTVIKSESGGLFIALEGELGAGKTCFSQGFIRALSPQARVKSPTYTLVESYPLAQTTLYHLDLYRVQDAEELEYLGVREFLWHSICLIEWASRAGSWLPSPDLSIQLTGGQMFHRVSIRASSEQASVILAQVSEKL